MHPGVDAPEHLPVADAVAHHYVHHAVAVRLLAVAEGLEGDAAHLQLRQAHLFAEVDVAELPAAVHAREGQNPVADAEARLAVADCMAVGAVAVEPVVVVVVEVVVVDEALRHAAWLIVATEGLVSFLFRMAQHLGGVPSAVEHQKGRNSASGSHKAKKQDAGPQGVESQVAAASALPAAVKAEVAQASVQVTTTEPIGVAAALTAASEQVTTTEPIEVAEASVERRWAADSQE